MRRTEYFRSLRRFGIIDNSCSRYIHTEHTPARISTFNVVTSISKIEHVYTFEHFYLALHSASVVLARSILFLTWNERAALIYYPLGLRQHLNQLGVLRNQLGVLRNQLGVLRQRRCLFFHQLRQIVNLLRCL